MKPLFLFLLFIESLSKFCFISDIMTNFSKNVYYKRQVWSISALRLIQFLKTLAQSKIV